MRPSTLFAAMLAGCLSQAAAADARDRHGHGDRQVHSFAHQSFASRDHRPWLGGRHHRSPFAHRWFGFREHRPWLGGRHERRWSGPTSGLRAFGLPRQHRQSFGHRHSGFRFSHRPHVLRFADRPLPLSLQPGHRILAGRQISPFVSARPLVRPVIVRPRHHFPSFVRVAPGAGFAFRDAGFGIPHRRGGPTIIVRDPGRLPPWR